MVANTGMHFRPLLSCPSWSTIGILNFSLDDERVEVRDQVYDAMAAPNGSEADSDKGLTVTTIITNKPVSLCSS